jgi:hypothetical protein
MQQTELSSLNIDGVMNFHLLIVKLANFRSKIRNHRNMKLDNSDVELTGQATVFIFLKLDFINLD